MVCILGREGFFVLCSLHARTKGTSTARGCTVHLPDVRECRGPLHVFFCLFFLETSEVSLVNLR